MFGKGAVKTKHQKTWPPLDGFEIIDASQTFGWRTCDYSCLDAYKKGLVSEETALLFCSKRGHVTRGIDHIKKTRGETTTNIADLRMTPHLEKAGPPPVPVNLKLK